MAGIGTSGRKIVTVNDSLELVGFDTGFYVSGFLELGSEGVPNLCQCIMKFATKHVFRLLVLEGVLEEFREVCKRKERESVFDNELREFLAQCLTVTASAPSLERVEQEGAPFWVKMRHGNDVPIAIAVRDAGPDRFVHSNPDHWKPSLKDLLGGVRVVHVVDFCRHLGILDERGQRTI
jgi:hypothetical protein